MKETILYCPNWSGEKKNDPEHFDGKLKPCKRDACPIWNNGRCWMLMQQEVDQ